MNNTHKGSIHWTRILTQAFCQTPVVRKQQELCRRAFIGTRRSNLDVCRRY
ncbi:hypothetical protein Hanom_Chr01g00032381 [Helianthus anomalus]